MTMTKMINYLHIRAFSHLQIADWQIADEPQIFLVRSDLNQGAKGN